MGYPFSYYQVTHDTSHRFLLFQLLSASNVDQLSENSSYNCQESDFQASVNKGVIS